ncbi:metallophosphoesterase [Pseudohalioglobus lutimaris]|uniref:Metallophosphoesterase n=2 Tax=Pseudohalioglobus lutimaris TaxID=1737061 RepID=A0A2N5WYS7_9GAMM|nr:metallophosphoesterase [Pseudohalioglobus lutimaris]
MSAIDGLKTDPDLHDYLVQRVGKSQLRRRLGIETEHVADKFGQGRTLFHIENWSTAASVIHFLLKITRMSARGKANVTDFCVRQNTVDLPHLPIEFDGFTILQLSDLHLDILPEFPDALAQVLKGLEYDICVLTGDYRFLTHGPHEKALHGLERICKEINRDTYAILGNHDSILMARGIESLGIQLLLNENIALERAKSSIHLAGIDDPHYYAADNLESAYDSIPDDAVSLLLAHSPEIYRHAAYTGFDFMMCGHTHAGQICLPGSVALAYNSSAPRFTGAGAWSFDLMQGYTSAGTGSSVVPARFNCPPELTLHRLRLVR